MTAEEIAVMESMALELQSYRDCTQSLLEQLMERRLGYKLKTPAEWPRIKDLTAGEQNKFIPWLRRNAVVRPVIGDLTGLQQTRTDISATQDAYYPQDYTDWKREIANRPGGTRNQKTTRNQNED